MNFIHNWQNYALSVVVCATILQAIFAVQRLLRTKAIQEENQTLNWLLLVALILIVLFVSCLILVLTSSIEPVHYFLVFSAYIMAVFVRFTAKSNHELVISLTKSEALEHYYATHDDLTGLSNLTFFNQQLEKVLGMSRRNNDEFALLIIGLNRFKVINETLGYFVGDTILQEIANRIRVSLRKTDLIARLGGDEFAVLITPVNNEDHLHAIAKNITESVQEPLAVEGKPADVGVSIGVAVYPKHASNGIELIEKARNSLIASEKSGEPVIMYSTETSNQHLEDIQIIGMLQRAIQEGQLKVLYQPQVRLSNEEIISAEALIRWQHPNYGLLNPGRFIPYAEKTGLIYEINLWLLNNVTSMLIEWREKDKHLPVAINITAHGFLNKEFQFEFNKIINKHSWITGMLKIELTETSSIDNVDQIRNSMLLYRKLGLKFSLDDYGTKHASLEYLKKLPFDELKIDQSFIVNAATDEDSRAIIQHAKEIAQQLKMTTMAEGIESKEVLEIAKKYGVDNGQGFYFNPAVEADKLDSQ